MCRYIELTASSYDEAKKTIMDDAYLNGKRFAGEDEIKSKTKASNGRKNRSRSRSKRQSKSTSRGEDNLLNIHYLSSIQK